ncbi:MAG TPA: hypothetical protein VJR29_08285 [bacterium]|nr:hypothetical protein [bacterium]
MNAFASRRIRVLVTVLVSLCLVEIGWSTLSWARSFKAYYKTDEVSRLVELFKRFRRPIPYHDKFNFLEDKGTPLNIQRYAQYALAPRPFRRGREEKWLIYYSPNKNPLPAEIAATHELVLTVPGGASLYRRKE